jgi:hypothetical protein
MQYPTTYFRSQSSAKRAICCILLARCSTIFEQHRKSTQCDVLPSRTQHRKSARCDMDLEGTLQLVLPHPDPPAPPFLRPKRASKYTCPLARGIWDDEGPNEAIVFEVFSCCGSSYQCCAPPLCRGACTASCWEAVTLLALHGTELTAAA